MRFRWMPMVLDRDAEMTFSGRPVARVTRPQEPADNLYFANCLADRSIPGFRICRPAAWDETRFRLREGAWTKSEALA